ncbi:hypothetical protein BDA96_05G199200 [Sorghum bicolor]|uniref:NB-ARC domain-containing protein n=1 Tax=Sorghum bicolor TaxID=4558 RepID=A0A921R183_SORBI|nr:hypothetical protein BDA96_05G199200 [Sorghum bicolor]
MPPSTAVNRMQTSAIWHCMPWNRRVICCCPAARDAKASEREGCAGGPVVDVGADGGTDNAGAPSDETGGVGEPLVAAAPAAEVPDAMNTDTRLLALALLRLYRYLIVFDGIEEEQWDFVKFSLPENTGSRVIVTTRIQTVAEICCNHGNNGYVYNMRSLDEKHSKDLLDVVLKRPLIGLEQSSTLIVNKCHGHPLTLFSVANYLGRKREFTETDCKNFWNDLGSHMAKEYTFRKLQKILLNSYRSLPAHPVNLKTCLLYVCVFPNGHPIKRSSLTRRWSAEGYVQDPDPCKAVEDADKSLEELIDRNIIQPINPRKNGKVKAFRAHGIMHEFMLHISMSAKFITTLRDPQRSNYRHLFMNEHTATSSGRVLNVNHRHSCPAIGGRPGNEKLRAHSLTICGSAGKAVVDFANCELLRVLDIKECNDLNDYHMDSIHKLWHLKYLSLGPTISCLPRQIEKLHCLETLDMRKSRIEILPVEVLKLPHLAHLLGKFKLEKRYWKMSELGKFLPKESNLQTLAGFVTDRNPGFPMLMIRMKRLRKVKIWCNDFRSKTMVELLAAIKKFVEDEADTSIGVRSLSLHLGNYSRKILHSLENSFGYLSSLKLHGALREQTQFVTSLCGLTELCLSSTNNLMDNDISNLRKLIHLEYLKLVEVSLGGFIIRRRDFPRLRRLSLVQSPTLPTIEQGALRNLISLHLLDERLCDLAGIEIRRHEHLQEIALDSEIKQEAKTVWQDAAKKHPKRPTVLYLKKVDPQRMGSMVKYVALEAESCSMHEERRVHVLQSVSDEEHTSALNDVNFAGPSVASTELHCERNDGLMACSTRASILVEAQGLLQSSSMFDQQLPVGIPQEKAKAAAQETKGEISLSSHNPNFGGLEHGKRSQSADDRGRMKESNYDADHEDDGKDKNYKRHKSFSGYQKAAPGIMIKETAVHGFTSAVRNTD